MRIINDPIYEISVKVFYRENAKLEKLSKKHFDSKLEDVAGFCFFENPHTIVIGFTENKASANTIIHECFHVCCRVFEKVGISINKETEEAFAYYLGYMTEKILEYIVKLDKENAKTTSE